MRFCLAVLAVALLQACDFEADFSDQLEVQTLVAEEYQQEIASVDRLLFTESPLGEEGVRSLERLLDGLAVRVRGAGDTKFLQIESLELQRLAKRAGRLPPDRTGAALQNDWMRLRNNLFDDRAWFVRSADDLEYAASVVPPQEAPDETRPEMDLETPQPDSPREPPQQRPERRPPLASEEPATAPHESLRGRWRVASMLVNGNPVNDPELAGAIWSFDPPQLVVENAQGTTRFNVRPEGAYLRVMTPAAEEGWMLYERGEDGLRVAFYDGLGAKPTAFEADPSRQDPALVVVRLVPVE